MKYIFDIQHPKVGLLSIGEEESKGNELVRATHKLLKNSSLNFIGNMEGRDILKGTAEVVVCDGFVGNIVLKFAESIIGMFTRTLKKSVGRNIPANLGAILMKPAFRKLRQLMDYQEYGGVPRIAPNWCEAKTPSLLGGKDTVVIVTGPQSLMQTSGSVGENFRTKSQSALVKSFAS